MKAGSKLKSTVCETEIMVIKTPGDVTISCGGQPMTADRDTIDGDIDPAFAGGTMMGKRYANADATLELLCIRPGKGSLSIGETPLQLKDAKPLPSSD
ncbi:hypothetical protein ACMT1E_10865 [Sphingomonas flavalba]|uniref:hypothetical protein n=1 Tax=Sphingomonas flavalba TaxID=2559804 RepID=UPI0039E1AD3B